MQATLAIIALLLIAAVLFWFKHSVNEEDVWSIGLLAGPSPSALAPHPQVSAQPIMTAQQVSDVPASFVADPFLVPDGGRWHLFFEVLNEGTHRGEIAS